MTFPFKADYIDTVEMQRLLFSASPSRADLLSLAGKQVPAEPCRLYVLRNQSFEFIASVLEPFMRYAGFTPRIAYSDYDDSLSFQAPIEADVILVWLDFERYLDALPVAEIVSWVLGRMEALRAQTASPILLGHVLEHVDAPAALLEKARGWLAPGGVICAAVPNARSIHRQAAVIMRLLPTEDSLNEADVYHGHRRVYNPESFRADFLAAGLAIHHFGGYWLKPVSNSQIEQTWTPAMLAAFMQLGERYPDIAGEIFVIAGH